jgi:hypothetical protein
LQLKGVKPRRVEPQGARHNVAFLKISLGPLPPTLKLKQTAGSALQIWRSAIPLARKKKNPRELPKSSFEGIVNA